MFAIICSYINCYYYSHKDGSARLWVCSKSTYRIITNLNLPVIPYTDERINSSLRTRIGLVVHTANYFDFHPKEKQPTVSIHSNLIWHDTMHTMQAVYYYLIIKINSIIS